MSHDNPYAPPVSEITFPEGVENANDWVTAGLGIRFLSALIDTVLNFLIVVGIHYVLREFGLIPFRFIDASYEKSIRFLILGLLVFYALHWRFLRRSGQTIGKKIMKLKIVMMNGEQPSMATLVLKRYSVYWLLGKIPVIGNAASLINMLFVFRKDRRCLHDWFAGTRVVCIPPEVFMPVGVGEEAS